MSAIFYSGEFSGPEERLPARRPSASEGERREGLEAEDEAGASMGSVVDAAESTRERLTVCGVIDSLENLRRGGRIGGAAAALGTLLSIKPVIEVRGGVVEQESRQRTRAKSLRYLAQKVRSAAPLERLAVVNAQAPDFNEFLRMVDDVRSTKPVVVGEIGPVIGTHAGPGTIGVAWVRERR